MCVWLSLAYKYTASRVYNNNNNNNNSRYNIAKVCVYIHTFEYIIREQEQQQCDGYICWPGVASAVEYLSPRWSCSANLLGVLWLQVQHVPLLLLHIFFFFSITMHLPRKKKKKKKINNEMARRRIFILYYIHLWNAVPFLMCIYICYIRIIRERER